jgi:ubiquinone/menaquinone biosynthesis C-methylase UbiE
MLLSWEKIMSDTDKVFQGSIPQFYDDYLVPLIFESYADDLANRVQAITPLSVLETAAGSGVVTRALAPILLPSANYIVTDLNQAMLDHAAGTQDTDPRITWQQADALDLPFDDGSFDTVLCQFGVMFFPDRIAGFSEARRVLKPGGRFFFNVWDCIEENEFADEITNAAGKIFPDDPPQFLARTPHGFHNRKHIREGVEKAGFSNVVIETIQAECTAQSHRDPAIAYCQGTPLRNEIEARDANGLDHVTDLAAAAIKKRFGEGPISSRIQAHVIVAEA